MLCKVSVRLLHHLCILRAQKLAVAVVSLIRIVREGKHEPDLFIVKRYRKIPKICPGAYIFQRPFLRGLFLEGPIFGGTYLRREICVSKSIGLPLYLEGFC